MKLQMQGTAAIDWKQEAQKQWDNLPCGSVDEKDSDLEYFFAVEHHRYHEYAPWMEPFFKFQAYSGKKVLEIGYGQGTDLCQFALGGAECYGVDITAKHYELAMKNFRTRGLRADLFLEDASQLHFEKNSFDLIYSFGVLHHTPDTIRCFSEAYRVLKPGGEFIVSLYHRYSAFHLIKLLLVDGIGKGKLRKLGYRALLSTIEQGADGVQIKPLVKLYTAQELRIMLGDFSKVSITIKHLDKAHFSALGHLLPQAAIRVLESKIGWYVIAKAMK